MQEAETLYYDDGSEEYGFVSFPGGIGAVKFMVTQRVQILKLEFYVWGEDMKEIEVLVLDPDFSPIFSKKLIPYSGWFEVEISSDFVFIDGEFYIGIRWLVESPKGPWLGVDSESPHHEMSYFGISNARQASPQLDEDYMIRGEVLPVMSLLPGAHVAYQKGIEYYEKEKYEKAVAEFKKCKLIYDEIGDDTESQQAHLMIRICAEALLNKGIALLEKGQYSFAKEEFEEALGIFIELEEEEKTRECEKWIDLCKPIETPSLPFEWSVPEKTGITVSVIGILIMILIFLYQEKIKGYLLRKEEVKGTVREIIGKKNLKKDFEYDIAISFAGEDRKIAKNLATKLKKKKVHNRKVEVFYDEFLKGDLWGKELTEYFRRVYGPDSRFVVLLLSEHYPVKRWTDFEFSIMREEAEKRKTEFILPVQLDGTKMEGIIKDVAYLDFQKEKIDGIVNCLLEKLSKPSGQELYKGDAS